MCNKDNKSDHDKCDGCSGYDKCHPDQSEAKRLPDIIIATRGGCVMGVFVNNKIRNPVLSGVNSVITKVLDYDEISEVATQEEYELDKLIEAGDYTDTLGN